MFLHWHHRLCRRAGGSGPAQSWPGTITTRWAAWRVRSCSAAAAPPSAEEDCCDPQGPPLPVVKLRNPLNNVPRVFICSFFGGFWVVCFVLFFNSNFTFYYYCLDFIVPLHLNKMSSLWNSPKVLNWNKPFTIK